MSVREHENEIQPDKRRHDNRERGMFVCGEENKPAADERGHHNRERMESARDV